ncbi:MAG: DUF3291 domain-containing protein [Actinomycetota bacterium]|nr:DUF3291 domain-containing protein [Actinomycetota bacterium]
MEWQLAQVNVGRLRAPIDDPLIAEFKDALDRINALADGTPGFVWRLQGDNGNATEFHPVEEDELVAINMSVWESIEALGDYVYRSDHTGFMRRRREWFEKYGSAFVALWWVPAEHIPTIEEAFDRLDVIERDGPTPHASAGEAIHADERDACPA